MNNQTPDALENLTNLKLSAYKHPNSWKISTFFLFAIVAVLLYKDYLNTQKLKQIVLQQSFLYEQKLSIPPTNSTCPLPFLTPTPDENPPKELGLKR